MYNIEEASKYLNVSKTSLRRWEKEGKIKPNRTPGGHRRYNEKDLLKLINKNE